MTGAPIRKEVLLFMLNHGGSFVALVAATWLRADSRYSAALATAFADVYAEYAAQCPVADNRRQADRRKADHQAALAVADRRATAPQTGIAAEVLAELRAAHRLFPLMLAEMAPDQKAGFASAASGLGISPSGSTRANEREAVIARASGAMS